MGDLWNQQWVSQGQDQAHQHLIQKKEDFGLPARKGTYVPLLWDDHCLHPPFRTEPGTGAECLHTLAGRGTPFAKECSPVHTHTKLCSRERRPMSNLAC
jgi:hypothetical protein